MKTIDYSDVDNKFIISNYHNTGSIKLFVDGMLVYNSIESLDAYFYNVSFTYDAQNVVLTGRLNHNVTLLIVTLENLLNNNIFRNNIFNFVTDYRFTDFETSKNNNVIAIYFSPNNYYGNSILGRVEVADNQKYTNFLQVYDFSNRRLLFEKISSTSMKFSLSELNTIAISRHYIDDEDTSINGYEIIIYDLVTQNRLNYNLFNYEISFIKYLPELEPNYNKLLVITREPGNVQNLKILDLENNFREIYNKLLGSDTIITTVEISYRGQIAIGTTTGLLYFDFSMNQDEEQQFEVLFNNMDINSIAFSYNGNRIKITSNEFSDIFDENYLEINHYNLYPGDHFPNIEDVSQVEVYQEGDEIDEEIEELEIHDPQLDINIPNQPTDQQKLLQHGNDTCMDLLEFSEQNIGNYLGTSPDNIVLFYKNPKEQGFLATCSTFEQLKKFLKDPQHVFYSCVQGKDFRTYHRDSPQYVKIPTGTHTIFANYQDIKQKYIQRQNMIFLEYVHKVSNTISYDASYTMDFVSSNHCQDGSTIDVYQIIF